MKTPPNKIEEIARRRFHTAYEYLSEYGKKETLEEFIASQFIGDFFYKLHLKGNDSINQQHETLKKRRG